MQGIGIFDNELLIVDRFVEVKNGDIVVANLDGEFVCKQLDTKRRLLLSANANHQPVSIQEFDSFSLEGRA